MTDHRTDSVLHRSDRRVPVEHSLEVLQRIGRPVPFGRGSRVEAQIRGVNDDLADEVEAKVRESMGIGGAGEPAVAEETEAEEK